MKFFKNKMVKKLTYVLAIVAIFSLGVVSVKTFAAGTSAGPVTPATTTTTTSAFNISGWTWSENYGWFSWNSTSDGSTTSYGANVDTALKATGGRGDLSGNIWSENLGWVSFDRTATNNPPSNDPGSGSGRIAQVNWATGEVTGWMRAMVGCEATPGAPVSSCAGSGAGAAAGGWSGWINLQPCDVDGNSYLDVACGGNNTSTPLGAKAGVKISANRFSGYGWGADADGANPAVGLGWMDFDPTLGGVDLGPVIFVPPCSLSDVPSSGWGVCQAISTTCTPTATSTPGVIVGQCSSGGTTVQSCTATTKACTAPTGGTCGDGVCDRATENSVSCPKDCGSTKVKQF